MPTLQYSIAVNGVGGSISKTISRTGDGGVIAEITVAVGEAGTLTTRTNDTSGTITMSDGGHGIATSDNVNVFWSGGVAYDVTVGSVSGTSVPISGASGDALPVATTAVVVAVRQTFNVSIDGDELGLLALLADYSSSSETSKSHVQFLDSGSAEVAEIDLTALEPRVYDITGGDTNPFTGNVIASGAAANASTSNALTLKILAVQDATP